MSEMSFFVVDQPDFTFTSVYIILHRIILQVTHELDSQRESGNNQNLNIRPVFDYKGVYIHSHFVPQLVDK